MSTRGAPWRVRGALAVFIATSLAGCMVGPDYQRPQVELPAAYPEALPGGHCGAGAGSARGGLVDALRRSRR